MNLSTNSIILFKPVTIAASFGNKIPATVAEASNKRWEIKFYKNNLTENSGLSWTFSSVLLIYIAPFPQQILGPLAITAVFCFPLVFSLPTSY